MDRDHIDLRDHVEAALEDLRDATARSHAHEGSPTSHSWLARKSG